MVKTLLASLLAGAVTGLAAANTPDPYEGGEQYYLPRPEKLPRIARFVVTTNGARSDGVSGDETAADCASFRRSPRSVTAFFSRAHRVSYRAYWHDLDMSRCYVAGIVLFANGATGQWFIDREQRALIAVGDGRLFYFHCRRCR